MVATGVSLGKTIEFGRVSPLERAKETTTIPPAMQKIICILNGAAHQCPESEVRITMKSPS